MSYVIADVIRHAPGIKEFQIRRQDGAALPPWLPGSHIIVDFSSSAGSRFSNHYSLVGMAGAANRYRIVVQREEGGKGGSRCLHDEFGPGSEIQLSGPFNSFPLEPAKPAKPARVLLVAGGIGITPLVSMAHALGAMGQPLELHYLARDRAHLVLLDELRAVDGVQVREHVSAESGRADLAALLGAYSDGDRVYACGPHGLLQGLSDAAAALAWPSTAIHVESFGARAQSGDEPLVVELSLSEMVINVQPGTSILDALIANDVFVSYECKRGECATCYAQVLQGHPQHRDVCLTPAMREQGMCTCVSWADAGTRLVLEL
ncbi:2Fe-2S iron-sulfur cluster binding domain-containing protein [Pseudoduganella sp. FT55W]|uniref:2Fe-2S iron-sulfur cluster binding domain-containing protein n=1 Tax=Duganella rivi TaxID=2666083 RepID=A0A7X4GLI1_9BURK|nr:PDR/VanB family oxidoreductase [Duganella rivi]MYM65715.1 2Fe-2S iron-sulfur cluster binding domain-containing protein [Duganella rivi]